MTTLVTGTGLIGVHAVRALIDEFAEPTVVYSTMSNSDQVKEFCGGATQVRGDILNLPELIAAMRDNKVDTVVHSAVIVTDPAYARPYAAIQTNVLGTVNVIEAAAVAGARRVVLIASNAGSRLLGEGSQNYGAPAARIFMATRLASEQIGVQYSALRGVRFFSLRLAALFGPTLRAGTNGTAGRIQDAINLAVRGEPIMVKSRRDGKRPHLYVKNAAHAVGLVVKAKEIPEGWEHITVGAEEHSSFADVTAILGELTGLPAKLEGAPDLVSPLSRREGESPEYESSRAYPIGYKERYNLREGLADYLAWARDYQSRNS